MEPFLILDFIFERFENFSKRRLPRARGFTIFEMLVVLVLITVLTSIVLVSQGSFNRTLLLTDTAYTVALSIRETQTFGLSSQEFSSTQNAGYGVDFQGASTTSYIQFADVANTTPFTPSTITWCPTAGGSPYPKPGNCLYDGSGEIFRTYSFNQGFTIAKYCAYNSSNALIGCSTGSAPNITRLDIVYQRPNTTTIMTAVTSGNLPVQAYTGCIEVGTPDGTGDRWIKVTQLGEISVLSTSTCTAP